MLYFPVAKTLAKPPFVPMTIGFWCSMVILRLFVILAAVSFAAVAVVLLRVFMPEATIAMDQSGIALAVVILAFTAVALGLVLLYGTVRLALADDRRRQLLDDAAEMEREQRERGLRG